MNVSSRTPDGRFNHCPVCGQEICIAPSEPAGDAPCPNCGVLLWFFETMHGFAFFERSDIPASRIDASRFSETAGDAVVSHCEVTFFEFEIGSRVKITAGTFRSFEGKIENVDSLALGKVTVIISIFGRDTPVDVEVRHLAAA